jgi:hypothetical protein
VVPSGKQHRIGRQIKAIATFPGSCLEEPRMGCQCDTGEGSNPAGTLIQSGSNGNFPCRAPQTHIVTPWDNHATTWATHAGGPQTARNSEMVPIIGFELMTYRLQGGCSTN